VYIDAAQAGSGKYRRWQEQTIGSDDHQIGIKCTYLVYRIAGLEIDRLANRQTVFEGKTLDRALLQFATTPGRTVRLRIHRYDAVLTIQQ
jgi:methylmalonyl-CoA mutase cobalamin-binding subunit